MTIPESAFHGVLFPSVAPDGRSVVLGGTNDADSLWLRSLSADDGRPIAGTEGGSLPFWSPDSRSIGFFAQGALKRVDIATGTVSTICEGAQSGRGGSWSRDGTILFAAQALGTISRVNAAGGTPSQVTTFDAGRRETSHRWPRFLPDGRHFLYFASSVEAPYRDRVYFASPAGGERRVVLEDVGDAFYAGGRLLTIEKGSLMSRAFDSVRGAVAGGPMQLAEHAVNGFNIQYSGVSAADDLLAYVGLPTATNARLMWLDRSGARCHARCGGSLPTGDSPRTGGAASGSATNAARNGDLWIEDVASGARSRLTFGFEPASYPVWSADGSRIAFTAWRDGKPSVREISSTGSGAERVLFEPEQETSTLDWSPDGRSLLLKVWNAKAGTNYDVWLLPLDGTRKPVPILDSSADEYDATFSPDGHWLAYGSNAGGRSEVYVQAFPGPGGKRQVSTNGGSGPMWRRDGKELFFFAPDGRLLSSQVTLGETFQATPPTPLGSTALPTSWPFFFADVSPDGQRILVSSPAQPDWFPPIRLIIDWRSLLEAKTP